MPFLKMLLENSFQYKNISCVVLFKKFTKLLTYWQYVDVGDLSHGAEVVTLKGLSHEIEMG
jgi:hypothetical protein